MQASVLLVLSDAGATTCVLNVEIDCINWHPLTPSMAAQLIYYTAAALMEWLGMVSYVLPHFPNIFQALIVQDQVSGVVGGGLSQMIEVVHAVEGRTATGLGLSGSRV